MAWDELPAFTTCVVELGPRSYPIYIGNGILQQPSLWAKHLTQPLVIIVTNPTVGALHLAPLVETFAKMHIKAHCIEVKDGETYKNAQSLNYIYEELLKIPADRNAILCALGGGVVGDMTGFAAATYYRGIDFIQIPTTLLAQVDASVGGKTAINHPKAKNAIGAFHQPRAVFIDLNTLNTLPEREFNAGFAEVIKYGLIEDKSFFEWLEVNLPAVMQRQPQALHFIIQRACKIKAEIVALDERESGVRAHLNFGHTFGHAIESLTKYRTFLHGEAISIGMMLACQLSERFGTLSEASVKRVGDLLKRAQLPTQLPINLDKDELLARLKHDKKTHDSQLRFILLKDIGQAYLHCDFNLSQLKKILE